MAEDAGSKNGTLIRGRRITRERLSDGQILELETLSCSSGRLFARTTRLRCSTAATCRGGDGLATLSPAIRRRARALACGGRVPGAGAASR